MLSQSSTTGANVLQQHHDRLRGGLYLNTGGYIYRHWRISVPEHVFSTKGRKRSRSNSLNWKGLVSACLTLFSLRMYWVRGRPDGYPIAIQGSSDASLLIDPQRRRVLRLLPLGTVDDAQLAVRREWARYISSPAFDLRREDRFDALEEAFTGGVDFRQLDVEAQSACFNMILRDFTSLVAHMGHGSSYGLVARLLNDDVLKRLRSPLIDQLDPQRLRELAATWPLTPTYADSHAGNVLVAAAQRPVFIDCLPMISLPFFYTPLYLILRTRGLRPLRSRYYSGAFDDALRILFSAAGTIFPDDPEGRRGLLVLTLLLRVSRGAERAPEAYDPNDLTRRVHWFMERSDLQFEEAWH